MKYRNRGLDSTTACALQLAARLIRPQGPARGWPYEDLAAITVHGESARRPTAIRLAGELGNPPNPHSRFQRSVCLARNAG